MAEGISFGERIEQFIDELLSIGMGDMIHKIISSKVDEDRIADEDLLFIFSSNLLSLAATSITTHSIFCEECAARVEPIAVQVSDEAYEQMSESLKKQIDENARKLHTKLAKKV